MGELLDASMAWIDPWWDPEVGLLWNMEGAYDEIGPARSIHLVPQSAWYAAGLLFRQGWISAGKASAEDDLAVAKMARGMATVDDEPRARR